MAASPKIHDNLAGGMPWERPLRVLVVTLDHERLLAARVLQPLQSLQRLGWVESFDILCHKTWQRQSRAEAFDVIWIQREGLADPVLFDELVGRPFLYDIDDLLLAESPAVKVSREFKVTVKSLLRECTALSATNESLVRELGDRVGRDLFDKWIQTPNGFEFGPERRRAHDAVDGLIWTGSDLLSLQESAEPFWAAVRSFAERQGLPLYLVGQFDRQRFPPFPGLREEGFLGFWQHKALLQSFGRLIPVAPLETATDPETLAFLACKSDIKMVEYAGMGHCGVYTDSPSFRETDLKTGILVENTTAAWVDGLQAALEVPADVLVDAATRVRERRSMDRLAREHWAPALARSRLLTPLPRQKLDYWVTGRSRRFWSLPSAQGETRDLPTDNLLREPVLLALLQRIREGDRPLLSERVERPAGLHFAWDSPAMGWQLSSSSSLEVMGWWSAPETDSSGKLYLRHNGQTLKLNPCFRPELKEVDPTLRVDALSGFQRLLPVAPGLHCLELCWEGDDEVPHLLERRWLGMVEAKLDDALASRRDELIQTLKDSWWQGRPVLEALPGPRPGLLYGAMDGPAPVIRPFTAFREHVFGWALLPDGAFPSAIRVKVNERSWPIVATDQRPDVLENFGFGDRTHPVGYSVHVPTELGMNRILVEARAASGQWVRLGETLVWNSGWDSSIHPRRDEAYRVSRTDEPAEADSFGEPESFVLFCDEGVRLYPETLRRWEQAFVEAPEKEVIYGDFDHCSGGIDSAPIHPVYLPEYSSFNLQQGLGPIGCLAVRRGSPLVDLFAAGQGESDRPKLAERARQILADVTPTVVAHLPGVAATLPDCPAGSPIFAFPRHLPVVAFEAEKKAWPSVTILIPTRNRADLVERVVRGLKTHTDYPSLEVLLLDNDSDDAQALRAFHDWQAYGWLRRVPCPGPFNFSAINNRGAREATGELLLFLNNDIEITEKQWLKAMVRAWQSAPAVGAVGARLLYPDHRIQHGGIFVGVGSIATEAFRHLYPHELGVDGRPQKIQEFSAVTAACLLTPRERFLELGGFETKHFGVAYNDVDYCLRLREAGDKVVWTPRATLIHHESQSRGYEENAAKWKRLEAESEAFRVRWEAVLKAGDPFYSPVCDPRRPDFYPLTEL